MKQKRNGAGKIKFGENTGCFHIWLKTSTNRCKMPHKLQIDKYKENDT